MSPDSSQPWHTAWMTGMEPIGSHCTGCGTHQCCSCTVPKGIFNNHILLEICKQSWSLQDTEETLVHLVRNKCLHGFDIRVLQHLF